ncbi:subtilisin-like serine protease [Coniosporium apollinis]|uniref:Subtilisin-like serine protease n=1 Tax=Coniosporium apollinis TaxID=61459 RepID=A0ABQ9NT03_9PEZI|nr:subtilisin-like serine protease [Coniosporium apollinis]
MRLVSTLLAALPLAVAVPVIEERQTNLRPRYIVVFKPEAPASIFETVFDALPSLVPDYIYNIGSFKGFAAPLTEALLTTVTSLSSVAYVEPDSTVYASALTTQANAPYGLARISHRNLGSNEYVYDDTAGADTCSYIIDTGIYTQHNDFGGRATHLVDYSGENSPVDGNGHGTHVAGTVGSTTYGVAKKTKLYAVKVLGANGSGTNAGVLAGINFAANDAQTRPGCKGKSVGNLSLGGVRSAAMSAAAAAAVEAGLFLAVAAGNSAVTAELASPASEPKVCTVGASDASDRQATFSNYGLLVDVFAPGVDILSTWIGGAGATNTISGTSMASPHVAGLAAYLLTLEGEKAPQALCQRIKDLSSRMGQVFPPLLTTNELAFNGVTA